MGGAVRKKVHITEQAAAAGPAISGLLAHLHGLRGCWLISMVGAFLAWCAADFAGYLADSSAIKVSVATKIGDAFGNPM
jgi:hypothetical protein